MPKGFLIHRKLMAKLEAWRPDSPPLTPEQLSLCAQHALQPNQKRPYSVNSVSSPSPSSLSTNSVSSLYASSAAGHHLHNLNLHLHQHQHQHSSTNKQHQPQSAAQLARGLQLAQQDAAAQPHQAGLINRVLRIHSALSDHTQLDDDDDDELEDDDDDDVFAPQPQAQPQPLPPASNDQPLNLCISSSCSSTSSPEARHSDTMAASPIPLVVSTATSGTGPCGNSTLDALIAGRSGSVVLTAQQQLVAAAAVASRGPSPIEHSMNTVSPLPMSPIQIQQSTSSSTNSAVQAAPITTNIITSNDGSNVTQPTTLLLSHKPPPPTSTTTNASGHTTSTTHQQADQSNSDPLKCSVCGKKFSLQRLLNRHMKCHSDVKRYSCAYCGKGFNDTFDLKRHIRTHSGVRPYKCAHCEKSFTQRCSLESHSLKVHGIAHKYAYKERRPKVYVCEECGNTTSSPEVHFNHLRDYHQYSISSQTLAKFYDKRRFKFSS